MNAFLISDITWPLLRVKSPASNEILICSVLPAVTSSPSELYGINNKSNCITPLTSVGLMFTDDSFFNTSPTLNEESPEPGSLPNDAFDVSFPA